MSTAHLLNIIRREASRVTNAMAQKRLGTIDSYDPANYAVKVKLQPDGALTGWIPLASPWVGNGWGLFLAPSIGDSVVVDFQEGSHEAGIAELRLFGSKNLPLAAPSGEAWLVHKSGSLVKFHNDGSVEIVTNQNLNATVGGQANLTVSGKVVGSASEWDIKGNFVVTGNIQASGDLSDQGGAHGTVGALRTAYDSHTHIDSRGGATSGPSATV